MPKTIKNDEGEDEEVYTADELQAERDGAVEKYKEENPDKSDEVEKLQEDLKKATEALEKADDKGKNFNALRKAKEDAEKKVADILAGVDEKIGKVKNEVLEGVNKDHYNDTVAALAGDDEELKKKIEFHYKRLTNDPSSTKGEITAKLKDAYTLATGQASDGMGASVYGSGGAGRPKAPAGGAKLNTGEKDLAKKIAKAGGMTLEDKDFQ